MPQHELAGTPAPSDRLTNVPRLVAAYFARKPDAKNDGERVSFGTSGHRGSALAATFNEDHVLAIAQAVSDLRDATGPLYIGLDTHALSEAAFVTALEVFAANGVSVRVQQDLGYTPTPAVSHAILQWNTHHRESHADGVVITPSHNPPEDGGFKYNPPSGGPADTSITTAIQDRANELLESGLRGVRRIPYRRAVAAATTEFLDFVQPYVDNLADVVDMDAVHAAGLKIGVDPMGGAGVDYWEPIADRYNLDLTVVNTRVDPRFSFIPLDHDGRIRMDCSSPHAMANLIGLKDRFDVAFGNDPDVDRHGVVTRSAGLLNPNHYLSVAVWYLFQNRPEWNGDAAVAKTLVTSSMIDRVAGGLGRRLVETPVGFKWFVRGLLSGTYGFGGEESAGASFLRRNGTVWTSDKDGIVMALLAAEITARTGRDPSEHYRELEREYGHCVYERADVPATAEQKAVLKRLSPETVTASVLAGEPILRILTRAPDGAAIGGLKVVTENGWFAARPSGTEDIYKIYAESFRGADHLNAIQDEARAIVAGAFRSAGLVSD